MKITIERFPLGALSPPNLGARYLVTIDQPNINSINRSHNESWQFSLAAAFTYAQSITEIPGL
jgi:hypothetical protein